jgi:hypothetical protein
VGEDTLDIGFRLVFFASASSLLCLFRKVVICGIVKDLFTFNKKKYFKFSSSEGDKNETLHLVKDPIQNYFLIVLKNVKSKNTSLWKVKRA